MGSRQHQFLVLRLKLGIRISNVVILPDNVIQRHFVDTRHGAQIIDQQLEERNPLRFFRERSRRLDLDILFVFRFFQFTHFPGVQVSNGRSKIRRNHRGPLSEALRHPQMHSAELVLPHHGNSDPRSARRRRDRSISASSWHCGHTIGTTTDDLADILETVTGNQAKGVHRIKTFVRKRVRRRNGPSDPPERTTKRISTVSSHDIRNNFNEKKEQRNNVTQFKSSNRIATAPRTAGADTTLQAQLPSVLSHKYYTFPVLLTSETG
uniref:Uncharacterized protein n=1 Tax=Phaeodactylum tricornutum TaxID=2850 RepID=A0A8J9SAL5_PHATR